MSLTINAISDLLTIAPISDQSTDEDSAKQPGGLIRKQRAQVRRSPTPIRLRHHAHVIQAQIKQERQPHDLVISHTFPSFGRSVASFSACRSVGILAGEFPNFTSHRGTPAEMPALPGLQMRTAARLLSQSDNPEGSHYISASVQFQSGQPRNHARHVVITGAGIVTALGLDWSSNAEGFRLGRTGFRGVTLFDVSRQRVKTAAQIDLPHVLPHTRLGRRQQSRLDRAAKLLLLAAHQAWSQSGWQAPAKFPLVLGTTSGGMTLGEAYYRQAIESPLSRRRQPGRVTHYQAQRQGLDLQDAFGFAGPVFIIANACASGANALGHAWSLLRTGWADRALAGGYDALSHLVFSGFDSLQALSPTQCRPFDAGRDGLALGEGAAVFALETAESARNRRAHILAELAGYGAATDIHHLTQPHPEGTAALASMDQACHSANLEPAQIDYLNAHGTGTPLNDAAEALAINRWAGAASRRLPVSSSKSSVGHLLGAAGAAEAAVCLMALQGQWLPPTPTLQTPDSLAAFPIVRRPSPAKLHSVMSNSFGFGGANASLVLRRWT